MNIRKSNDYSSLYSDLDVLMGSDLAEMELYSEIGRAVCARTEKGAAVMAAEYIQSRYPERRGFSPRNLRRMRSFYLAYGNTPDRLEKALKLAWTQNVTILEGCKTAEERVWYINATLEHGWGKSEIMAQIQDSVWMTRGLDEPEDICYTEEKEELVECGQSEKDTFYLSRQYLSEPNGRVCHERPCEKSRIGARVPDRLRSNQPGGAWESSLPAGQKKAGGAWDWLFRPCGPAARERRLRGVRPVDRDGSGKPPEHVPYLRRRLCWENAPSDGVRRPTESGGGRSMVHRQLRSHLAGCAGGLSGTAGSNHCTRMVSTWHPKSP